MLPRELGFGRFLKFTWGLPEAGMVTLGTDWYINLINAFSFWKAKMNWSFFVVDKFFATSHWPLWWYIAKFHVDDKNYWCEKVMDHIFILPRLSTALHKVTITKTNLNPRGLFDDWSNGAGQGTFDSWNCGWHVYRIILLTRPIIVWEVFCKNIDFLL